MKKLFKIIGIVFLVLMGLGSLTKAIVKPSVENSFEEQIRKANRDCPIPVANGVGQVSSIFLENNFIVYKLDYQPGYLNVDAYRQNPSATRDMFYLAFICMNGQGGQGNMLAEELIKRDYGLKIVASNGSSSFTSELTPVYIKNMRSKVALEPSEALHDALRLKLETESAGFPIQIEEGMCMTGMKLERNNIVVLISINENLYDISALESVSDDFSQNILDEANSGDPEMGALLDLCKISHSGMIYRMIGDKSNRSCDFKISSDQILRKRITPPQVNIK